MADITAFPKSGADILGGLAKGAQIAGGIQNIQASRANVQLQQQAATQQAQQQQFAQEQVIKQQEQAKLTTQLDRTDKLINSAMSKGMLKTNPEFMRKLIDSSNTTSSQLFPDSPNFDFDAILNNSEQFEKDWKAHQLMENEGMHEEAAQFLNEIMPNYLQQPKELAAITGAQTKIETEITKKEKSANIAEATKGLAPQVQSVIGLAAEGSITPSVAALLLKGSGVNVKSGIADAQGNPMTIVFDDTGKQIASFPEVPKLGGAGAAGQAQILREPLFNEYGEKVGEKQYAIYKNAQGDFVKKPIEEEGQQAEGLVGQGIPPTIRPPMVDTTAQRATPAQTRAAIEEAKTATKGQAASKQPVGQAGTREGFIASAIKLNKAAIDSGEIEEGELGDLFDSRNNIGPMTFNQFKARMKLDKSFAGRTIEQWKRVNKGKPIPILTDEKAIRKFYNNFKKIGE